MRVNAVVVLCCIVLGACGWTGKRTRGTNYDPASQSLSSGDDRRRL